MSHNKLVFIENFLSQTYEKNKKPVLKNKLDNIKIDTMKMILSFELSNLEILKSGVHGNGVFTTKPIKKGELLTFYPGDIVRYYPNGRGKPNTRTRSALICSDRYNNILGDKSRYNIWDNNYCFDLDNYYSICGYKYFIGDSNYLGHIINDGAKHNSTKRSEEIYMKISIIKSNCVYQRLKNNLHLGIVSTKDIKAGEELFATYGINYWRSHNNIRK